MYFRGRSHRSLDNKSRVMLPTAFRDILLSRSEGGKLVLTTYDRCVMGFPLPDWEEFEQKFHRLKNPSLKLRHFRRLVIGGAEEIVVDKQGRIRLPADHVSYGGLQKEIVLVGQGSKFEIWDKTRFEELMALDFDDVADELTESGIDFPI
ncbi:division/cell wall cluster transcriptional repressor MraZ [Halodesulfovibrio sp.]|uniref:division/cell wall cluster transcriptional repressor MraZ n=1 Tax=Halodesulfovibrio sp. TaxID=1912772 RepID=UPI0025D26727|nr:division/cell wall cluster transcriptional repressor MraZ [Halodesulfovibrio sp.]MCT4535510.1 division/cell wall cluster transcriptional repressor MraZ [Halodesulfovibrio sp.]MCT4626324.1 division/cell wall cluster transcriptional repressor MraZ [Halodesulfovibrio sp.]